MTMRSHPSAIMCRAASGAASGTHVVPDPMRSIEMPSGPLGICILPISADMDWFTFLVESCAAGCCATASYGIEAAAAVKRAAITA